MFLFKDNRGNVSILEESSQPRKQMFPIFVVCSTSIHMFKEKAQTKSKAGNMKSQFRTVGAGYQLKQKRNNISPSQMKLGCIHAVLIYSFLLPATPLHSHREKYNQISDQCYFDQFREILLTVNYLPLLSCMMRGVRKA